MAPCTDGQRDRNEDRGRTETEKWRRDTETSKHGRGGGSFFYRQTDRERETERETERDGERQRQTETDRERDRDEGRVPQTDLEVGAKALAVVRPPVLPGVAGLLAPRRDGSSEVGVTRRYVLTHQQPRIACASKQAHNGAQRCCLLQCQRKAA